MNKTPITAPELRHLAILYIRNCLEATEEKLSNTGQVIRIKNRHIPTINYFLSWWVPYGTGTPSPTICRKTFYNWKNSNDDEKKETANFINDLFESVAIDIVANEGKGIFYAKNKLGMTDKVQSESTFDIRSAVLNFMGKGGDNE
jgi:hypothetical protein